MCPVWCVRLIVDTASAASGQTVDDCLPDHSRQRRQWCKPNVGSAAHKTRGVIQTLGPAEIDLYHCAVACKWW